MEKRLIPQNAGRHRNHWKPNGVIAKVIAKHEDMAAARSQILDEIGRLEQNGPAVHELDLARMRRRAENWPAQGWHHEDRIEQVPAGFVARDIDWAHSSPGQRR
jgi:hypothetical protein